MTAAVVLKSRCCVPAATFFIRANIKRRFVFNVRSKLIADYYVGSTCAFSTWNSTLKQEDRRTKVQTTWESSKKTSESHHDDADTFGDLSSNFMEPSRRPKKTNFLSSKQTQTKSTPASEPVVKVEDVFGLLNPPPVTETSDLLTDDEGDKIEEKYLNRRPIHWKTAQNYARQMKKMISGRDLKGALEHFNKMIEEDGVKPDSYAYGVLIGGCGKAGYSKMAFKLYNGMKKRGLKPHKTTYTCLFNSCANSPWPEDGLKLAHKLYQEMKEKGIIMNNINYHAAIKAFGRCGDLQMAFRLVDEMVKEGVGVTSEAFNFLLSGCASDSATGLLHAIRVWRKMRTKNIRPDIFSYNLLLRAVRDSGIGDPTLATNVLLGRPDSHSLTTTSGLNQDIQHLPEGSFKSVHGSETLDLTHVQTSSIPDLLSPSVNVSSIVKIEKITSKQDRLALLGGAVGFLKRMDADKVKPELKSFTELLELIPGSREIEEFLMDEMKKRGVVPDIDFFNVLIKRRNVRHDLKGAKYVLTKIAEHRLPVDIATFGTLAMGCETWDDARCFLQDMEVAGFRLNIFIMGALLHNACASQDFWYVIDVMKRMKSEEIRPDQKMLLELETCVAETKKFIVEKEKDDLNFNENNKKLINRFKSFMMYYREWLKAMELELPEHPWSSYKTES